MHLRRALALVLLQATTHCSTAPAPDTHQHVALTLDALHFMASRFELPIDLLAAYIIFRPTRLQHTTAGIEIKLSKNNDHDRVSHGVECSQEGDHIPFNIIIIIIIMLKSRMTRMSLTSSCHSDYYRQEALLLQRNRATRYVS